MLTILLTILKIIGILLLTLIGIVLLVVLCILFVPIRYQAEGAYYDEFQLKCGVHWLLHLLGVKVFFQNETHNIVFYLFGIPVYDVNKRAERKRQKEMERRKKSRAKRRAKKQQQTTNLPAQQPVETVQEEQKTIETTQVYHDESLAEVDEYTENEQKTINNHKKTVEINKDNVKLETLQDKKEKKTERIHFKEKIKLFFGEMIKLFKKIGNMFLNIKYTFRRFYDRIMKAVENIEYYKNVFQTEEMKRVLEKSRRRIMKILKNIKPKRAVFRIDFGTGDPAQTGDILCVYSMFYPWIGQTILVNPDFERALLQGDFKIKGRITLFHFACAVWIYLFDKDIMFIKDALRRRNSNDR